MDPTPMSRDEARRFDRRAIEEFGIPGIVLMENAGAATARWIMELGVTGPVIICCGKGNNGGDGYVVARHLHIHGVSVRILTTCSPSDITGDALTNYRVAERIGIACSHWDPSRLDPFAGERFPAPEWIVDGLLGTGSAGAVREPLAAAIRQINDSRARKLAIDIPSGLDCDTGRPLAVAVRADFTATFVAMKVGFTKPGASAYTGVVRTFGIGI
jgi:NAD(P)H-hydrate epimerase